MNPFDEPSPVSRGLRRALDGERADLRTFRAARILISGGTGFVGRWILSSIRFANALDGAAIRAVVITRNRTAFAAADPLLARDDFVTLVDADVRTIPRDLGTFDAAIHAATPASADLNVSAPLEMLDTIVDGGRSMLETAARSGRIPFLFLSSGAIYGDQAPDVERVAETATTAPDPLAAHAAYHEGKRVGEVQCAAFARAGLLDVKIARLFAFVGPYLPIDRHFAAGNFVRNAIAGDPIRVNSDGRAVRSYLSAADMVAWLWAVFARGATGEAYNVGSPAAVTIGELAEVIGSLVQPAVPVLVRDPPDLARPAHRYVPDVTKVTAALGVRETIDLRGALGEMIAYYASR